MDSMIASFAKDLAAHALKKHPGAAETAKENYKYWLCWQNLSSTMPTTSKTGALPF